MEDKKYLEVSDIANELGFSEAAVRSWIRSGKLVAGKIGRDYRIRREDYEDFLKRHFSSLKDEEKQ